MINKKKLIALFLFAAMITTIIPANLNIPSIGVVLGNPSTMTFNNNLTIQFGNHNNETWVSYGIDYLWFKNQTAGANITQILPWDTFEWVEMVEYGQPAADTWWYITGTTVDDYYEIYTDWIAIHVNSSSGGVGKPFTVDEVWSYWYMAEVNYTIGSLGGFGIPPGGIAEIDSEQLMDILDTGETYMDYSYAGTVVTTDDSWWSITYSGPVSRYGTQFHISDSSHYWTDDTIEIGAVYDYVTIDEIRNGTTNEKIDNVTLRPAAGPSTDGISADQWIGKIKPDTPYYITVDESAASILPEASSVWNITAPNELDDYQFNITKSEKVGQENFLWIDQLWNSTHDDIPTVTLTNIVEYVEAECEEAPKVAEIGSWYNVIDGPTPEPHSWYNITASDPVDTSLVGAQFYVDMTGERVFHIDEVRSATGDFGDITLSTAVNDVTAEELTPALYVDPVSYVNEALGPGDNFTVAIKTNFTMNIWGYEFTLAYNPFVLNVTNVANITNGDVISNGATFYRGGVDYAAGEVLLTGASFDSLTDKAPGNETTLAYVNFTVVGEGDSFVTLGSRVIKITNGGQGEEQNIVDDIIGLIVNGYFRSSPEVTHDITFMDVDIVLPYGLVVSQNASLYPAWNVTVETKVYNKGTIETYDVKVYYDFTAESWLLDAQSVVDHAGLTYKYPNLTSIATDVFPGNHTIKVKAILAYGIEDEVLADNIWTDIEVQVRIPADIQGDEVVDKFDFWDFAKAFGSEPGDTTEPGVWNPWADYGEEEPLDGEIDRYDFSTLADYFGKNLTTIRD